MTREEQVVQKVQDRLALLFNESARGAFEPWPLGLDVVALDESVATPEGAELSYYLFTHPSASAFVDALLVAEAVDTASAWVLRLEALVQ